MSQPPRNTPGDRAPSPQAPTNNEEPSVWVEAIEATASAYFSACRKLARAISHLKKR